MSDRELIVLMNGDMLGHIFQASNGSIELIYDDSYRNNASATPISTSMPLTKSRYTDRHIRPFLEGLLPDNTQVLERWGSTFGVSRSSPFALLCHVGEDCAGAAQFVRPERFDAITPGGVDWLNEADIETRLRAIRIDPTAWLWGDEEQGQFSLAGAQSKLALYREGDRWGHPYGRVPTSHILKVASGHFAEQETAEHVTMRVARLLGMAVAGSELTAFGDERAIVVERYDRLRTTKGLERVHQEDFCQTLSLRPEKKYQRNGGPGPVDIIDALRLRMPTAVAEDEVRRFTQALIFNWLIGGTDAHAKNYSLLMLGPSVSLAPLYDLTTGLPYRNELLGFGRDSRVREDTPLLRMAMSIGGESYFSRVTMANWQTFAQHSGIDIDWIMQSIRDFGARLPDAVRTAVNESAEFGLGDIFAHIVDAVTQHVAACMRVVDPSVRSGDA